MPMSGRAIASPNASAMMRIMASPRANGQYIGRLASVTAASAVDGSSRGLTLLSRPSPQCPGCLLIRSAASSSDLRIWPSWLTSTWRPWPLTIFRKWSIPSGSPG
jgi:hypothetical protein